MASTHITLQVITDYGSKELVNQKNVTLETVIQKMETIDWNTFHQVILSKSKIDWIEVGGNITKDGLSCIYEENSEQFYIDEAPTSILQMKEILTSYFKGDNRFKKDYKFTGDKEELKQKEEKAEKLKEWNKEFAFRQKTEKASNRKRTIITLLILTFVSLTFYFWYTNELQFLGQKTDFTKAKIIETKMHHIGSGKYMQRVTYQFRLNEEFYTGKFEAGTSIGRRDTGEFVKVKFSINHPERSKMVGVFKKK